MTDTLLLERTTAPVSTPARQEFVNPAAAFTKAVTNPFPAAFEVLVTDRDEWRPEELQVIMHTGGESIYVDKIQVTSLPRQIKDKAAAVREAYEEAYNALEVTFGKSVDSQLKGWSISGEGHRFVLQHKGLHEVFRNMAYETGNNAHKLLGMGDNHPSKVSRAQMIFKY